MSIETGGPAFPVDVRVTVTGAPLTEDDLKFLDDFAKQRQGMTLRDWFAGQALAGMTSDPERSGSFDAYASDAYRHADAMLKARGES